VCVLLFAGLGDAQDPSRRADRIPPDRAAAIAVRQLAGHRAPGYQAVHVAYAPSGDESGNPRWVVLCDRAPRTALRDALVVELHARDGKLLAIRKPVN
jgi:hypothetical protein